MDKRKSGVDELLRVNFFSAAPQLFVCHFSYNALTLLSESFLEPPLEVLSSVVTSISGRSTLTSNLY